MSLHFLNENRINTDYDSNSLDRTGPAVLFWFKKKRGLIMYIYKYKCVHSQKHATNTYQWINYYMQIHLQQLLLHSVSDQVRSRSPGPAFEVVCGDGVWNLGGVQRLLQPRLLRRQWLRVGQQLVNVLLQLWFPVVGLLQSLPQKTCPLSLGLQSGRLSVLVQSFGLPLDAAGFAAVGGGLLKDAVVVGEPLRWGVFSWAVAGCGRAWGWQRVHYETIKRGKATT